MYYLCVTPFFPSPGNWRGAYILDQIKAIQRNSNYKVVVFRPCGLFQRLDPYETDGITVHYVPSWFMPSYFFNGMGGSINGKNIINKLRELDIGLGDIAVVHCHTTAFACYATSLKCHNPNIKTVIQYHDLDPYQVRLGKFAKWRPNITYRVKKFVSQFKYIDLHLCISQRAKYNLEHFPIPHPQEQFKPYLDTLMAAGHLAVPHGLRSYVLYNGVDVSIFNESERNKDTSIFKIGCVSNFNALKDHSTLIRAIEIIVKEKPGINLMVSFVGSGETKEECQQYISDHGLEKYFVFENEMEHDKLPAYFKSLDLFVLPSCFEGFGCVYTEASACGVPFMGCYDQGYSEYIPDEDKDRWLIRPHDYRQLAKIIMQQIETRSEQRLAYPFDIDVLIRPYLEELDKL